MSILCNLSLCSLLSFLRIYITFLLLWFQVFFFFSSISSFISWKSFLCWYFLTNVPCPPFFFSSIPFAFAFHFSSSHSFFHNYLCLLFNRRLPPSLSFLFTLVAFSSFLLLLPRLLQPRDKTSCHQSSCHHSLTSNCRRKEISEVLCLFLASLSFGCSGHLGIKLSYTRKGNWRIIFILSAFPPVCILDKVPLSFFIKTHTFSIS